LQPGETVETHGELLRVKVTPSVLSAGGDLTHQVEDFGLVAGEAGEAHDGEAESAGFEGLVEGVEEGTDVLWVGGWGGVGWRCEEREGREVRLRE
jgi:hypothetical protein